MYIFVENETNHNTIISKPNKKIKKNVDCLLLKRSPDWFGRPTESVHFRRDVHRTLDCFRLKSGF